jgi:hypothetical protein
MEIKSTEAQLKARKKWADKNKEKTKYITNKSKCKYFILNQVTNEDIEAIKNWVNEREIQLNNE